MSATVSECRACRFLRTAFEPGDWIAVLIKPAGTGQAAQRVRPLTAVLRPEFHRWLRAMDAQGCHIFVSVNTLTPEQRARTREAIRDVRHVMLDCDRSPRGVLAQIRRRPDLPRPSYVVHSSPGRAHILWRVTDFTPSLAERLARQLACELGTDPAATACTQLTRLAGYSNHKRPAPHIVDVTYAATIVPYAPADFPAPASVPLPTTRPSLPPLGFGREYVVERARRYVQRVPPAIAGQYGDLQTFKLACALVRRFGLDDCDALALLAEWNTDCKPPWTLRELHAKIGSAHKYGR